MLRIFILYAISGFVSLGYQVAWFRIFTDWFGSTNLTFALVVCCFIGGLGLGALWSHQITGRFSKICKLPDRLRLYVLIELLISIAAILTLLMGLLSADIWGSFPYHEANGLWVKNPAYQVGQVLVAILCVLIPCLFMGVTFPLLCNAFVDSPKGKQLPAALYAWNTLGAASGVIACQFWFLPLIGHHATFMLMVAINVALGLYFLLTGGGSTLLADAAQSQVSALPAGDDNQVSLAQGSPAALGLLLTAAVLSGLMAGALEGDMFKRISFVMANTPGATMSAISFWAILGIFLSSTVIRVWPRLGLNHIKGLFLLAIVCYGFAWLYSYPVLNEMEQRIFAASSKVMSIAPIAMFPTNIGQLFIFVGVYVFPAFFLISFLLPWVCNHLQANRRHLGLAYGLNTLAFCVGMIGFTLIAPLVSIFYSLKLIFVLLVCGAVLLLLLREDHPVAVWKPAVVLVAFLTGCFIVPGGFDYRYVNPKLDPAKYPVTSMKSNGTVTTFVVHPPGRKDLYFGNLSMSGTSFNAQTYMRLMAHFPLLAQRNPEKALLICFGVGNTASAIATHDTISQIDIVDLNDKVFETAPEFSNTHSGVHLDPRVRFIHDDGRAYLSLIDERYDLITSEPPPPMAPGIYRLYSREYYEDVLAHLTPTGMMSQWLPYYQMPPEAVARAVRTFTEVFPHALMISGYAEELLLIGGSQPADLDLIRERFSEMPAVVSDLLQFRIAEPVDIFSRIVQTNEELRKNYADAGLISDENNHLEHVFASWDHIPEISYDPVRVLDEVRLQSPVVADAMLPIVSHLGRLNYRVPLFPLAHVRPDPEIKYSDADWNGITHLSRKGVTLIGEGRTIAGMNSFLQVLQLVPEHPLLLALVAQQYLANHQPVDAEKAARRLTALEPDDASTFVLLASAIAAQGRGEDAIAEYRQALMLESDYDDARQQLARILATHPDARVRRVEEALLLAEQANQRSKGENPEILNTLAAAYAANGRFDEAVQTAEAAVQAAVQANTMAVGEQSRRQLELYRQGQPVINLSLDR